MSAGMTVVALLLTIYVVGLMITLINRVMDYQDAARPGCHPDDRRRAAHALLLSPLWPLDVALFVRKVWRDAR